MFIRIPFPGALALLFFLQILGGHFGVLNACEDYSTGTVVPLSYHDPGENNNFIGAGAKDGFVYTHNPPSFGVEVVDVRNPLAPEIVDVITQIGECESYAFWNDYMYAVSYSGVAIVDVSVPGAPTFEGYFTIESYIYQIDIENGYLYLASYDRGLDIASLSEDPTLPSLIGHFPMQTKSVQVFDGLAFLRNDAGAAGGSLKILDVSDPVDIRELADFGGSSAGYYFGRSITVVDQVAYFNSSYSIVALDISTPEDPVPLVSIPLPGWAQHIAVKGRALYASENTNLHVIDITQPELPVYKGSSSGAFGMGYEIVFTDSAAFVAADNRMAVMPLDCLSSPTSPVDVPAFESSSLDTYPNPFNPSTTIEFSLAERGHVLLEVFDLKGNRMVTLVDQDLDPGEQSFHWRARGDDGGSVASGTYFLRLKTKDEVSTRKVTVAK